ncbi:BRO family, N-terminal domain [Rhodospira trueperi]|uniref:BRO family, N-terminal domain n=1 Tax=Rhodospira trueperi TaxID=69960 RepID=A0A1G7EW89_9PROT|nr:BRO family, N-terminal domain [Rhodospira trueperi]
MGCADADQEARKHCKALKKFNSVELTELGFGDAPSSDLLIIPERDVYRRIMRSRLPQAEAFEEWVVGPAPISL